MSLKKDQTVKVLAKWPYQNKIGAVLEIDHTREYPYLVDVGDGWSCWFKKKEIKLHEA